MKKFVSVLLVACILLSAGCTGPFKLTKGVHHWQTKFENRWVDEVAFLGCVILPVYELAMLGDAIIFNSVQFWTGDNPMDTVKLEAEGKTVEMALQQDGSITVSDGTQSLILERTVAGIVAKDADGNVMYRAVKGADNLISVYDASGNLIRRSAS